MKRSRIGLGIIALAAAGSLALAGCASGGDAGSGSSGGNIITANGSEPQRSLIHI